MCLHVAGALLGRVQSSSASVKCACAGGVIEKGETEKRDRTGAKLFVANPSTHKKRETLTAQPQVSSGVSPATTTPTQHRHTRRENPLTPTRCNQPALAETSRKRGRPQLVLSMPHAVSLPCSAQKAHNAKLNPNPNSHSRTRKKKRGKKTERGEAKRRGVWGERGR